MFAIWLRGEHVAIWLRVEHVAIWLRGEHVAIWLRGKHVAIWLRGEHVAIWLRGEHVAIWLRGEHVAIWSRGEHVAIWLRGEHVAIWLRGEYVTKMSQTPQLTSTNGKKVAAASVLYGELYQFRLPDNASIFSAELRALNLALSHIQQDAYWRYIIFTDSLSAMQAMENKRTDNPLIVTLLDKISEICTNAHLVFCWLRSHVGINGNEEADKAA